MTPSPVSIGFDPAIASMIRIVLAATFAQASLHKLRDIDRFQSTLSAYRLPLGPTESIRRPVAALLANAIPAIVMLLALWLIASPSALPAGLAASLLLLYSTAIGINLARGRLDLDCGCSGPAVRQPIGSGLIVRNTILMAVVGLTALPSSERILIWVDAVQILCGALGFVILISGFDTAMRNHQHMRNHRIRNHQPQRAMVAGGNS